MRFARLTTAQFGRLLAVLPLAAGLAVAPPLVVPSPAFAQGNCAVWSTYTEQDGKDSNLTATACASTEDDSAAIGVQCNAKKQPVIRFYPGDGQQDQIHKGGLDFTFAVGDQGTIKTMRWNDDDGAFAVVIGRNDVLLQMFQSGGPMDVSTLILGSHRFRLLGSTAAIAAVFGQCGLKKYIGPPPPPPPDPDASP